jgi:hypothetical protein
MVRANTFVVTGPLFAKNQANQREDRTQDKASDNGYIDFSIRTLDDYIARKSAKFQGAKDPEVP